MTKQELQEKLTEMGVEYSKRLGEKKLQELYDSILANAPSAEVEVEGENTVTESTDKTVEHPQYTEEQIKRVEDELMGRSLPPIEETLKMTVRDYGEVTTEHGLIIPPEVLTHYAKTEWEYMGEVMADKVVVTRLTRGRREFVREYTRSLHGERFADLAKQFIDKKNKV